MAARPAATKPPDDARALAVRHALLRYGTAVTVLFVLSEAMAWKPTFLAAVFASVLLSNLPGRPPLKVAIGIVASLFLSGLSMVIISLALYDTPVLLFGATALCLFVTFHAMLSGGPALPLLLALIAIGVVPVITMASPAQAWALPSMLLRGVGLAMLAVWAVFAIWPAPPLPKAVAKADVPTAPFATAVAATAILVPLMLLYLLFTPVHAMPALMGAIIVIAQFQMARSARQAWAYVIANLVGGLVGLVAFWLVLAWPHLLTLALVTFAIAMLPGARIAAAAANAGIASIAANGMLIIFSSSLAAGPGSPDLWIDRVFYYSFAGLFAIGGMQLLWHRLQPRDAAPPSPAAEATR